MHPSPIDHSRIGRLTPFIGRQADLQKILELFQDPCARLVTILGAGGIGKTRFALEAAALLQARFPQGMIFVPLAALKSPGEFLPTLAAALSIQLPPGSSLEPAILNQLADLHALLVFDNFEHLLDESVHVRDILAAAPRIRVLVTSREKLCLEDEVLFHLQGLPFPPAEPTLNADEYDAIRLFLQKARQARADFSLSTENLPAVIRICRMVGGNPLGILLAASWLEHFSPVEIADEIGRNLDFLTSKWRDAEPRHRSMRAVLDASLLRLDQAHRSVFRKLAVFRGGFDLAAARAIAGADLSALLALVDRSLLSRDPASGRYELHELLRQYAGEALPADERERVVQAHASYYTAFIKQREPRLISPAQTVALDEIQADLANIRQAYSEAVEKRDMTSVRLILPGLYAFCDMRSRAYEGERIFWQAVEGLAPRPGESPHGTWALALLSWYDLRVYNERFEPGEKIAFHARSCLGYAASIHDAQGIAASLVLLGAIAEDQGDFKTAIQSYKEALRYDPSIDDVYWVNMRIGLCYQAARQYPEAVQVFRSCLRRSEETGEKLRTGWSLANIGETLLLQKKPTEAKGFLERSGEFFQQVGNRFGLMWSTYSLCRVAKELGDPKRAREHAQIAAEIAKQVHSIAWIKKTDDLLRQFDAELSEPSRGGRDHGQIVLSERELEVLQLLKSELSGPEIARRLFISLNTVRYHTKNIYQKLGVNTRLEAIRRAKEFGL